MKVDLKPVDGDVLGRARFATPEKRAKRTDRQRAEELAQRFVSELQNRERLLGRPLEPADLSEEFLRSFGLEFWKRGEPVTNDTMRSIAGIYLKAAKDRRLPDRFMPGG